MHPWCHRQSPCRWSAYVWRLSRAQLPSCSVYSEKFSSVTGLSQIPANPRSCSPASSGRDDRPPKTSSAVSAFPQFMNLPMLGYRAKAGLCHLWWFCRRSVFLITSPGDLGDRVLYFDRFRRLSERRFVLFRPNGPVNVH